MSADRREVTLLLSARNLGGSVVDKFGAGVAAIGDKAEAAARKVGAGFENATNAVSNAVGNLTENLLSGQDLGSSFLAFGIYLGGQMAEGLIGQMLEKMAGSTLVASIGGALSTAGAAIGGLIDTGIGIGMAALPFVLVAAVVAAIAFLITHPEVAAEIARVAGSIVSGILNGLAGLAGAIVDAIVAAPGVITDVVGGFVGGIVDWFLGIPAKLINLGVTIVTTIVGGLVSLPGRIADVVRQAFENLRIDVGPFHISGRTGVTIDLPNIAQDPKYAGMTYQQTHSYTTGGGGGPQSVVLEGVSMQQIQRAVDAGLLFRLRVGGTGLTG